MASLEFLRRHAPGQLWALPSGCTHVRCEGPADAPCLLLIHGATVAHWEFDRLVPHLHAAGWRTVRYDLLGHGLSDRPQAGCDFPRLLAQALQVLEAAAAHQPVAVLGHSFGAALAAALAAQRPNQIGRLVLAAPLLDFMAHSVWAQLLALPGVGLPLMRWVALPALVRRRRRRYAAIGAQALTHPFVAQARSSGFARSLASMFALRTLGDQRPHYRRLGAPSPEIAVVAGSADAVVPLPDVAAVRALLPPHRYHELPGAGHNLLLTHPQQVAALLARG